MQQAHIFNPTLPEKAGNSYHWTNLNGASIGLALSCAIKKAKRPTLIIAPDSLSAAHLYDELRFFSEDTLQIHSFPDWETLPYDHFSPHQDIISERLATLYKLFSLQEGVIITTPATLMHRLPPENYLLQHSIVLKVGDKLNIELLRTRLTKTGYYSVTQVQEHGEFAIRGSIIDLFPMGSLNPFRIDLFDDEVDSIRIFSSDDQRSIEKIPEIRLLPAKEFPLDEAAIDLFRQNWREQFVGNPLKSPIYQDISEGICTPGIEYYLPLFFDSTASLFDYLPDQTLLVSIHNIEEKAHEFWHEINTRYEQSSYDSLRPLLKPEQMFIPVATILESLKKYPEVIINSPQKQHINSYAYNTSSAPNLDIDRKNNEPLAALKQYYENYSGRILFCVETIGRREVLLQLFNSIALHPKYLHSWHEFQNSNECYGIVVAPLENGFVLNDLQLTVITETHLFGKRVMQRRLRKKSMQDPNALIRDLTELQIDDAVVHIDHGVGRYKGLQTLTVGDQIAEFLCLEYQGGDKLYVPVASLHLINRYTGSDPEHTPINKLGTDHWQRAKRKAEKRVRDVAAELLDLYAQRAARPGHAYEQVPEQYNKFAAAFPFEETPDQLQAIEQVFADMTSNKPMDRVICGDVGFGKTEVALRAAFLAVQNNKQVALLVPTTLLAQQHFQNFQDRLADWPIQVDVISRFRTAKEQKQILTRLAEGKLDIVIGTHKLIQDNIKFKNLGLVILDEEHRFGVKQKEKLKSLRAMVDILTLTATPIPRTLNMALSGIRDLSIIATPPARRLSVKTFVHEYQNHLVQEAIQREILRGGQVYFLHNDISTINKKVEEISALVQEARPIAAHGQMHETELERVMTDFYHRRYNVLVCSTIIESGIDIPTANTIIINRADKFGLAQLHQLRGRVGRSHHQAYAYLLIPPRESITSDAEKRLDAIASLDKLGVGFSLATHDLEIRGAGELLGEKQSGEIHEIGFSLYMDLLSRAVDALKAGKQPDFEQDSTHGTEIELHLTSLIPEPYLNDVQLRLQFYKRIANAKTESALDDIQVEMIDRFGLLPDPLKNLFAISELKLEATALGIQKIEANDKTGKFEFTSQPNIKPEKIIQLIQTQPARFRLAGPTRLNFTLDPHDLKERINVVKTIMDMLK